RISASWKRSCSPNHNRYCVHCGAAGCGFVCSQYPTAVALSADDYRGISTTNSLCSIAPMGHRRRHRFRNCGVVYNHSAPDRISVFPILIMKSLIAWRRYVALFILCAALGILVGGVGQMTIDNLKCRSTDYGDDHFLAYCDSQQYAD